MVFLLVVPVRRTSIVQIEKIKKGNTSVIGDMMPVVADQSGQLGEFLERSPGHKCGYQQLA